MGVVYDSGDYDKTLDRRSRTSTGRVPRRAGAAARQGHLPRPRLLDLRGDLRPRAVSHHRPRRRRRARPGGWESAMVRVHNTGAVTVYTGASPHGQGHETTFAQMVADQLGVDPAVVEVVHGDTGIGPQGLGTYGSRSLAVGGEALAKCRDQGRREGARRSSLTISRRRPRTSRSRTASSRSKGSPDKGMTLAEVAGVAYVSDIPDGPGAGARGDDVLSTRRTSSSRSARTRASSTSIAETGKTKLIRYVAVDDCGNAINPLIDRRADSRRDRPRASARRCTSGRTTTRTVSS